jgi:hypothetical protein
MKNPDFLNAEALQGRGARSVRSNLQGSRRMFRVRIPVDAGQGSPRSAAVGRSAGRFFKALPSDYRYGVELRNAELLTDLHGEVLKRHRVAHVFNSWTEMPSIGEQMDLGWTFSAASRSRARCSNRVAATQTRSSSLRPGPGAAADLLAGARRCGAGSRLSSWPTTGPREMRRGRFGPSPDVAGGDAEARPITLVMDLVRSAGRVRRARDSSSGACGNSMSRLSRSL